MELAYVSDFTLTPAAALNGFSKRFGKNELVEQCDIDIVSIATPNGQHDKLSALLEQKIGAALPATGKISRADDTLALLGLQPDQCFLVSSLQRPDAAKALKSLTGDLAYLSEQTDSWAILDLTGPDSFAALERICPINISKHAFEQDAVARTSMEHLSVIIHRLGDEGYRLYSPRSSADSFLHAVTESLYNVCSTTTG